MSKNTIIDAAFGEVRTSQSEEGFCLEKIISIGDDKSILLMLIAKNEHSDPRHEKLFRLITSSFDILKKRASEFYKREYAGDLLLDYKIESIVINSVTEDDIWEIWFVRNNGFENCVIEFVGLLPVHISFTA